MNFFEEGMKYGETMKQSPKGTVALITIKISNGTEALEFTRGFVFQRRLVNKNKNTVKVGLSYFLDRIDPRLHNWIGKWWFENLKMTTKVYDKQHVDGCFLRYEVTPKKSIDKLISDISKGSNNPDFVKLKYKEEMDIKLHEIKVKRASKPLPVQNDVLEEQFNIGFGQEKTPATSEDDRKWITIRMKGGKEMQVLLSDFEELMATGT